MKNLRVYAVLTLTLLFVIPASADKITPEGSFKTNHFHVGKANPSPSASLVSYQKNSEGKSKSSNSKSSTDQKSSKKEQKNQKEKENTKKVVRHSIYGHGQKSGNFRR